MRLGSPTTNPSGSYGEAPVLCHVILPALNVIPPFPLLSRRLLMWMLEIPAASHYSTCAWDHRQSYGGIFPITFHAPGSTAAIFNKTYAEINSLYGRQASAEAAASIVTGLQKGFVNCFARTRHLLVEDGMEVAGGVRGTDWFARRLGGTTRSRGKFAPFLFSDCSDYDPGGAAATATWRSRPVQPRLRGLVDDESNNAHSRMGGFLDVVEKGGWMYRPGE